MKTVIASAFLLVLGLSVAAQPTDFERILVPIAISGEVPGAFGSRWVTHLAITNAADQGVYIYGYNPYPSGCVIAVCPPVPSTPPRETFFPIMAPGATSQGAIIEVDRQFASEVRFQLRVQDLSREASTWGTEIPVVREAGLFTGTFQLLDVPAMPGFRALLRLYDVAGVGGGQAVVRFYKTNPALQSPVGIVIDPSTGPPKPDTLLAETTVTLSVERRGGDPAFDIGYAGISDVQLLQALQGAGRVRIEIQPITPGMRMWGFVSVTNNETQDVTAVTPN